MAILSPSATRCSSSGLGKGHNPYEIGMDLHCETIALGEALHIKTPVVSQAPEGQSQLVRFVTGGGEP